MKPPASLSVDLDNHWSYLKTHGDSDWRTFPSYLDQAIPHILDFAQAHSLRLTVFVVGQDAALDKNADALAALGDSEHEIGNHSFHHEPWLHLKSATEVDEEIRRADEAILAATGKSPRGFRGPGFSVSPAAIESLLAAGYQYDASTLPTFIGPLARAFYFRRSSIEGGELEKREKLFGQFGEVLRPIRAYRWTVATSGSLLEIPVTTMPFLRTPIHATYLLYLAKFSETLSHLYFRAAISLCKATGVQPSLLLHSLDFLGGDEVQGLDFFPGMDMSGEAKRLIVGEVVDELSSSFRIVPMEQHAVEIARGAQLPNRRASALA